jgi:hypothetical protein
MKSSFFFVVTFILLFQFSFTSKGQIISALPVKNNAVYAFTGSNQVGAYIGVGFARTASMGFLNKLGIRFIKAHPMMLFGEFSSRTDHFGNNVRFTYGAQTDLYHKGHFRLPFKKTFYVAEARNDYYKSLSIGAGLGLLPGYYGKKFSIAADIFYNHNWTTNIWDLDTNYQDEPNVPHHLKAGWNRHIGGVLKTGLIVAYKPSNKEFFLEAGYQGFQKPNIAHLSMFYISFGLSYRF